MMLLSPPRRRRTAYLGPLEDAAFVATAASMWALYTHGWLGFAGIAIVLLPAAVGCFVLAGIELGVRSSGRGKAEVWRTALAWAIGLVAVFLAGLMCRRALFRLSVERLT